MQDEERLKKLNIYYKLQKQHLIVEIACEKNRMQCCLQCWCGVRSVSNPRKNLVQDEHAISAVNV